jgi:DNA-binding NarL/FixJ family response regulator
MADGPTALLVGQNLFFLGRVEALAQARGLELLRATDEDTFWAHFNRQKPALLLIDLEGAESVWVNVLQGVQKTRDGVKVVAFGPHQDVAALDRARALGCDLVLNKGEFNRDLPQIFGSIHAGDAGQ